MLRWVFPSRQYWAKSKLNIWSSSKPSGFLNQFSISESLLSGHGGEVETKWNLDQRGMETEIPPYIPWDLQTVRSVWQKWKEEGPNPNMGWQSRRHNQQRSRHSSPGGPIQNSCSLDSFPELFEGRGVRIEPAHQHGMVFRACSQTCAFLAKPEKNQQLQREQGPFRWWFNVWSWFCKLRLQSTSDGPPQVLKRYDMIYHCTGPTQ